MDPAHDRFYDAALTLPDGGTVGPLPDGTVIEVEATTWPNLYDTAMLSRESDLFERMVAGNREARQRILDVYNARQESS